MFTKLSVKEKCMKITNNPLTAVWEITMGCNMRCKHCGSFCENALEGELTTKEAMQLCDDLGELGFKWITLSGGEPTTRCDWDLISIRLNKHGILTTMISNGWMFDENTAIRAKSANINTVAFSLDGLKNTHDMIRKEGSYDRVMRAIDHVVENGLGCSIITTINSINIDQLSEMYDIISKKKICGWQLQIGLPMGSMAKNKELISKPEHVDQVINFAHTKLQNDSLKIYLADCMGYFNPKEIEIRAKSSKSKTYNWQGCNAGKWSLGILHNGDVLGCTSIRNKEFIEGNVKTTKIKDIWQDPTKFAWNRNISKDKLKGICKKCSHGSQCLGGCPNTRLTMDGSIYGENEYCSYNFEIKKEQKKISKILSNKKLLKKARVLANEKSFQLSEIMLKKIIKSKGYDYEAYALYGYVAFMLGNFDDAKEINQELIDKNPEDEYANKGYGLTIAKLGQVDEGIGYLKKAIDLSKGKYTDAYHDLAVVLNGAQRYEEALAYIEMGRELSKDYQNQSEAFYQYLMKMKDCVPV